MKMSNSQYFQVSPAPLLGTVQCCWHLALKPTRAWPVRQTHEKGNSSCCVSGHVCSRATTASQQRGAEGCGAENTQDNVFVVLCRGSPPLEERKQKSDWNSLIRPPGEKADRHPPTGGQTQEPEWKEFLKNSMPAVKTGSLHDWSRPAPPGWNFQRQMVR